MPDAQSCPRQEEEVLLRPSETAGTQTYIAQIDQTDSGGHIDELDQHFYSVDNAMEREKNSS